MPTYVYSCEAGHTFEITQSIKEDSLTECVQSVIPEDDEALFDEDPSEEELAEHGMPCGAPCKRVIQPVGVVLKGGGWYKDGYSNTPAKKSGGKKKKDT